MSNLERARSAIADFCRRSISSAGAWDYSQARPMSGLGVPPEKPHVNDCSGHATLSFYWARQQTGLDVPDPNHLGYNGSGYTGTLVENPRAAAPYEIGDMAIYGPSLDVTTHVVTCFARGSMSSAAWASHGSPAGPYAVALYYRGDLLKIVRPVLVVGDSGGDPTVQPWVNDWLQWYFYGQHHEPPEPRPPDAPREIPQDVWDLQEQVAGMLKQQGAHRCYQDWRDWYAIPGRPSNQRPNCAPSTIYPEWWQARNRDL